jgi:hypothetical protein
LPDSRIHETNTMAGFKDQQFDKRRGASAEAKRAMLEKFKARPAEDDPTVVARRAERQRIAEERAAREAAREAARQEEKTRQEAEAAEARERAEREAAEAAEREAAAEAERKAARDARYAARKARRK